MAWIYEIPEGHPAFSSFSDEKSTIESPELSGIEKLSVSDGARIVFCMRKRRSGSKINFDKIPLLPTDHSSLLLHQDFIQTIPYWVWRDCQIMDAVVLDGADELYIYKLVRPLVSEKCLDLNKSKVTWLLDKEYFIDFDYIVYKEDCMKGNDIAREFYHEQIVISDRVKKVFDEYGNFEEFFVRPEDLKSFL